MLKTRFYLICIFLFALFSANRLYAADYFARALRIYSEGKFYEASIEFERAIFYENDNAKIARYKYYKALCYRNLGENARAVEELNGINLFSASDSLYYRVKYEQALCNFLNQKAQEALWNLEDLKLKLADTSKYYDIIPLNILCLNTVRDWSGALKLWDYYIDHSGLGDSAVKACRREIQVLYIKRNTPGYYSPDKAENWSRFIPGSGQIYCGAVAEGSFNFLIHAGLLAYSFVEFYNRFYLTGYFTGLGVFYKFYMGGMHRARILADTRNREGIRKFNAGNVSFMMRISEAGQRADH